MVPSAGANTELRKSALLEHAEHVLRRFGCIGPITVGNDPGVNIEFPAESDQFEEIRKIEKRFTCSKADAGNVDSGHLSDDFFRLGKLHFFIIRHSPGGYAMGASHIAAG